jgi:hypothetical protein
MGFSDHRDFCDGLDGDNPRSDFGRQTSDIDCLDLCLSSRRQQSA